MLFLREQRIILCIIIVLLLVVVPLEATDFVLSESSIPTDEITEEKIQDHFHEIIVKWRDGVNLPTIPGTALIDKDMEERIAKLAVHNHYKVQDVMYSVQNHADIEYVQPNYRYKIHARASQTSVRPVQATDPDIMKQWHLEAVSLPSAWTLSKGNSNIIIAILDTGVDLESPDLAANLVPGYNVLKPELPPKDDYGHGTQVASILGSIGNNQLGGAGVLWNAKIMPIKVLDRGGEGDDYSIGQGIRYAVRNGAKVIVLSLGDRLYSKHMDEAVRFAENEGVLLVAATGNNGSTVNYPAAFPTVLAVGAFDQNYKVPAYSNFGPEIDVVAPGQDIYTTTLRGQSVVNSGTSMSAPIVAGIAGLIYSKYPDMKPWQVRQLLRQSAVDMHEAGWDQRSGYGRVDAYRALTMVPEIDIWENNNTVEQSKVFPRDTKIYSALQGVNDVDWFYIDIKHRGKVNVPFNSDFQGLGVQWFRYVMNEQNEAGILTPVAYSPERNFESGRYYFRVSVVNWDRMIASLQQKSVHPSQFDQTSIEYQLEHLFTVAEDQYEVNNTIHQAALIDIMKIEYIEEGNPYITVQGTLHRDGDLDWYQLDLPNPGEVILEVVNDYGRLDPVLTISRTLSSTASRYTVIDDHPQGAGEYWRGNVEAGKFYFMVTDYQRAKHPIPYEIRITYIQKYVDSWEPNNQRYVAPAIMKDHDVYAFLNGNQDRDWFAFYIEEDTYVDIDFTALVPKHNLDGVEFAMNIFESTKGTYTYSKSVANMRELLYHNIFSPGVYYIELMKSGVESTNNLQIPYKLRLTKKPVGEINRANMKVVLKDLYNPELEKAVYELVNRNIVQGFPDQTYRPLKPLTRGELVTLILRSKNIDITKEALAIPKRLTNQDIQSNHWAYDAMKVAMQRKIIVGYQDQTLRPDAFVTRAELAVMLRRAHSESYQELKAIGNLPAMPDVAKQHWAHYDISINVWMGFVESFGDDYFKPDKNADREQVALALHRILERKL
ncbi:hypothetical protein BHU72_00065 [Desulfuribacillus stibiiarsenatis]|uniref:SLH domain-containing protein n=1 Tax=Desulfuribacillus stibiiarsenatis TaxID=1390249 RepID=A0A1E5L9H3_9FIRM|nr:S8 family serine peptidase [Desulfuribacillus stibiiarsenatis]OEH86708.1 hypothetical protein BHU72_00065 [Desulfuribacillus stibiiarsenatis]